MASWEDCEPPGARSSVSTNKMKIAEHSDMWRLYGQHLVNGNQKVDALCASQTHKKTAGTASEHGELPASEATQSTANYDLIQVQTCSHRVLFHPQLLSCAHPGY